MHKNCASHVVHDITAKEVRIEYAIQFYWIYEYIFSIVWMECFYYHLYESAYSPINSYKHARSYIPEITRRWKESNRCSKDSLAKRMLHCEADNGERLRGKSVDGH